jgi:hypothetical protein
MQIQLKKRNMPVFCLPVPVVDSCHVYGDNFPSVPEVLFMYQHDISELDLLWIQFNSIYSTFCKSIVHIRYRTCQ